MIKGEDTFKKIISHCKEYGFIFPSSEIYDGLSAVYDYGQNGALLKNNIKDYWWRSMVQHHENIVGLDSAIFMHPTVWKASGHVDAFNDPLIDNKDSKKRYRADVLMEDHIEKIRKRLTKRLKKRQTVLAKASTRNVPQTNPRVVENQQKIEDITRRFVTALDENRLNDKSPD
jgi:glycyl-tRNA synthetase